MRLYVMLLSLSLIWGFSFVFIEHLLGIVGVWGTVVVRCFAGAIILLPILLMRRKLFCRPAPWKALMIVGIFNAGLPWGLIALSQTEIYSSTAAVLNALTPLFTGLIGFLLYSNALSRQQWGGIVLGFSGVVVLTGFQLQLLAPEHFVGVGTMILATICYGFASQYVKRHLHDTDVVLITTFSLLFGGLVGLIGMWITDSFHVVRVPLTIDWLSLISIIGLGCLGSGMAHLLYYDLMKKGGPEFATTVTYLIPMTAIIWGKLFLDELITKNIVIGMLMILMGVYFTSRKRNVCSKANEDSNKGELA
ncbi:DMT family transporter [Halalkalibacterium halodurans]|uniref:DMT family transporter n=1 Tax=Halalkalibacterium halodurans TaxID=86665 RepID=UPI002AAA4AC1|nr:DMT family transporter [Halalkalibacterium halodurans]MDY7220889.1 DMT family transporter [Halalkalibacterium halodurans]MDY7240128.1 DMT family transporter [Halalkalibacterium halodurans]MED4082555.1 DMT family transporter [Halalkalibacterium halodurans]MED4085800.1 DMT family transporter [Halalkalibacterium halodurans]MED4105666.1 DMT family transporter [Halalkalibacterium halodurans]